MNNDMMSFQRKIPVRYDVDVFVAGGGPAGVAAAVSAARQGCRVLLIECQSCLGGTGTSGGLSMFCQFTDGVNFVADGIGREICDRLWAANGMGHTMARGMLTHVFYKIETLKRVYDEMVGGSQVDFLFCTQCVGVEETDGQVEMAICCGKNGLFAVKARVFVDCTGNGDLCAWAGAPFEKGDPSGNMQPGTLCSMWACIDWERVDAAGHGLWGQEKELPRAFADKVFATQDRHLPGMIRVGRHTGSGNIGHAFGVDGTDERSLTRALVACRKQILEYERFYKEYLKGYENMELVGSGPLLGIRETRRIMGDYVLCLEDFKTRACFDDEIGRYSYPIDIHEAQPDEKSFALFEKEFTSLQCGKGESYGIPYRVLTPRGLENMLVAGRCVSSDRHIQGSIRAMPGCFITGQAAGMAAAIAVEKKTSTRGIDVRELQQRLKKIGAFLPNA